MRRIKLSKKLARPFFVSVLLTGLVLNLPVSAKNVSLSYLNDFSIEDVKSSDKGKAFDQNHWAYKTLKNVTAKYGVLIGRPEYKFNGSLPISRNEAALILVSLLGKIEEHNLRLAEADRAKIEILQEELGGEIKKLTGRVAEVEGKVASLQGSVERLEGESKKNFKTAFGENFKITGALQAGYTARTKRGADNYSPNFGIPYSEVAFSGKLHEKVDYFAQLVPSRNFSDTDSNGLLREAYFSSNIISDHKIYVGQITRPLGVEAGITPINIDFIDYSQASRNLISNKSNFYNSNNQDVGLIISGEKGFINYSAGIFNGSGNNAFDTNAEASYAGKITIKPFYKKPKLGNLEIGTSMLSGQTTSYNTDVIGMHAGYTYKKACLKGEFLARDGYLNPDQKALGWFIDGKYNLTNKWQLLARYDSFDPDRKNTYISSSKIFKSTRYTTRIFKICHC